MALTIAASCAALALAACGEEPGGKESRTPRERAEDAALKFSKCMRDKGIDIPDPQVTGEGGIGLRIDKGSGVNPDDPKFKAAERACSKILEAGIGTPSPERRAEMRDAGVKYARCMREHGVDMPDPASDGRFELRRSAEGSAKHGGGGPAVESPTFRAADKECHHLLARIRPGDGGPSQSSAKEATP